MKTMSWALLGKSYPFLVFLGLVASAAYSQRHQPQLEAGFRGEMETPAEVRTSDALSAIGLH